jgi:hypothetical protein
MLKLSGINVRKKMSRGNFKPEALTEVKEK